MSIKDIKYPFYLLGLICLLAAVAFVFYALRHAAILPWLAAVVCAGGAYYALKTARLW